MGHVLGGPRPVHDRCPLHVPAAAAGVTPYGSIHLSRFRDGVLRGRYLSELEDTRNTREPGPLAGPHYAGTFQLRVLRARKDHADRRAQAMSDQVGKRLRLLIMGMSFPENLFAP
jgi:hypothetical protein